MTVQHCERDWETPYCGECGKKLHDNAMGLVGLALHLKRLVASLKKREGALNSTDPGSKKHQRTQRNLEIWDSRYTELKASMDREDSRG